MLAESICRIEWPSRTTGVSARIQIVDRNRLARHVSCAWVKGRELAPGHSVAVAAGRIGMTQRRVRRARYVFAQRLRTDYDQLARVFKIIKTVGIKLD